MVMISYFDTNEITNTYVNLQTGQSLDLDRVNELKDNAMLKVKPELWIEWDFEKNEGVFDIWEMTKGTTKKPFWICKTCNSSFDASILKRKNGEGCLCCRGYRVNHTNSLATKNSQLASEWHPTKNGNLTPDDVTCGKNKKVWWLCEKGHEWEANIRDRNSGNGCPYCSCRKAWKGESDMWTTNPELASKLLKKEDGYKYKQNSNKLVDWKCLECGGIIRNKRIPDVKRNGLGCPHCSDGIKYPEKFMYNVLKELKIDFVRELSSNDVEWIDDKKRYDFYIPSLNCIIETHGEQHYSDVRNFNVIGGRTLEEERTNDQYKYELAMKNGIDKYVVIDCRYSDLTYIKKSILDSELIKLLNLININWEEVALNSQKSLVVEVCEMWNNGFSMYELIEITKLTKTTIRTYLKKGTEIGICNYNTSESKSRGHKKRALSYGNKIMIEVCSKWNKGLSNKEICEELNLSKNTVTKYLRSGADLDICNYSPSEALRRGMCKRSKKSL